MTFPAAGDEEKFPATCSKAPGGLCYHLIKGQRAGQQQAATAAAPWGWELTHRCPARPGAPGMPSWDRQEDRPQPSLSPLLAGTQHPQGAQTPSNRSHGCRPTEKLAWGLSPFPSPGAGTLGCGEAAVPQSRPKLSLCSLARGGGWQPAVPDLPARRWHGQPAQVALCRGRLGPAACYAPGKGCVPATARGQERRQGAGS